jgi:hypothetical protein
MYYRAARGLKPVLRWLLTGLRFAALFVLLLLLLEPVLTHLFAERDKPIVAVLADNSASMVAAQDSAYVRRGLQPALQQQLAQTGDAVVEHWRFAGEAARDTTATPLQYNGNESNLAAALQDVKAHYRDQNLAGIVLVSDGIVTEGSNPQFAADGLQVPVYAVLTGDTLQRRDVSIEQLVYNDISYLNMETPVQAHIRATGYDNAEAEVTLAHGGKVLEKRTLRLAADRPTVATFSIKLETVGMQQYDVAVRPLPGERTLQNNRRSFYINVLENRLGIVLIAGAPHPDVGALQAAFANDKRYNLTPVVRKDAGAWYTQPTAELLKKADVVILHNFPAAMADRPLADQLAQEVAARKLPVIHIVGTQTQLQLSPALQTGMALTTPRFEADNEEAQLQLTESYKLHASYPFGTDDGFYDWLAGAPPLLRNASDWEPQAGAAVYGKAAIKGIALDYPMLALQEANGAKSIVWVGENLWRLRVHAYREKKSFDYFDQWLRGLVQWAHVRQDKRPFRVQPVRQVFAGGDAVLIRGQVYDAAYKPLADVNVQLQLADSAGRVQDLYLKEVQPGAYNLELNNLEPGLYRYKATGTRTAGGRTESVGTDVGLFWVGGASLEYVRLQADAPLMRQVAVRTGGAFIPVDKINMLSTVLQQNPLLKPVVHYREASFNFTKLWWPLLLVLLLLSAEWVLRKRSGLA